MQKLVLFLLTVLFAVSYYSCNKDNSNKPIVCIQTDTVNTYIKSTKAIFDTQCASGGCHDAVGASGIKLNNYVNAVASAKTDAKFFCSIDWSCSPRMPKGYSAPIDTSQINAILKWRDNCYPE